ncbi:MAG: hypothetical protein PHV85_00045 [Desulfovibrionaceae bacterium]|nr:hypothetical protein [Desulfovibrionaceae bacterium]
MAYSGPGIDLSFKAGEDLSSYQYRFVGLSDDNTAHLLDSADEHAHGVLQNKPESGEDAVVRVAGVSKLVAGAGGMARGDLVEAEYVSASDNGKGIACTTNAHHCRARCIQAAGAEDDVAAVLLVDCIYTSVTS